MTHTQNPSDVDSKSDFERLAEAVDAAAAKVRALDENARGTAEELRRALEAVHRAGLVTIVRRLRADPAGKAMLFELVDEPEVRMLLSLHGIIRPAPKPTLIPLHAVTRRRDDDGWVKTKQVADLPDVMSERSERISWLSADVPHDRSERSEERS